MVSSPEEICNLGVAKIGHEDFITSLSENSKAAKYMNAFYEPIRDEIIRSHLWRFARKRAVLAPLTDSPAFNNGGEYYFSYPDDCLRIVGTDEAFFQSGEPWSREGDKIVAKTSVLNIVYLYRVENVSLFDPSFVNCFSTRLAYEACLPLTKDSSLKDQMSAEYRQTLLRAAHASATEQDGQKFISEAFLGAR